MGLRVTGFLSSKDLRVHGTLSKDGSQDVVPRKLPCLFIKDPEPTPSVSNSFVVPIQRPENLQIGGSFPAASRTFNSSLLRKGTSISCAAQIERCKDNATILSSPSGGVGIQNMLTPVANTNSKYLAPVATLNLMCEQVPERQSVPTC